MKTINLFQKYWLYSLGPILFHILVNDFGMKITLMQFVEDANSGGGAFLEEEDLNVLWAEMHDLEDPRNGTGLNIIVQTAHGTNKKNF